MSLDALTSPGINILMIFAIIALTIIFSIWLFWTGFDMVSYVYEKITGKKLRVLEEDDCLKMKGGNKDE